jgi:hypothetical protein
MRRLVLLVVGALALAACGGGSDLGARDVVAQAASATEGAGSYRVDMQATMEGFTSEPLMMPAEGVFDADERRGRMTMDMSSLTDSTGGPDLGEVEMVVDGLVFYLRAPFLRQLRPELEPWIRFDLQELGEQQGVDLEQLTQLSNQSNPSEALAYLRGVGDDVEEVGTEEVRGVATTHYRATVDLDRVVDQAPSEQREALRAQIEELERRTNTDEALVDVWIDDDGLVRRQVLRYEDMRFAGQTGDVTLRMELYDFGVEVDVEAPPEDQVTDFQELVQAGSA